MSEARDEWLRRQLDNAIETASALVSAHARALGPTGATTLRALASDLRDARDALNTNKEGAMSNFERYAVLVPGEYDVQSFELVTVLALDEQDAIAKACEKRYTTGAKHGTYLVGVAEGLTAYQVSEKPEIVARVSLPDWPKGPVASG